MSEPRFDVIFRDGGVTIEPHFCREWEGEVGCYGTNPLHGFTFDAAKEYVAQWHEQQARYWRELTIVEWGGVPNDALINLMNSDAPWQK